mmetsp:Transcript_47364/g.144076  ORF Transcript_47364/g.144076 Transcript_47364/m.144076 type:complete len:205 (-) Transcript_47364:783-1397(-)
MAPVSVCSPATISARSGPSIGRTRGPTCPARRRPSATSSISPSATFRSLALDAPATPLQAAPQEARRPRLAQRRRACPRPLWVHVPVRVRPELTRSAQRTLDLAREPALPPSVRGPGPPPSPCLRPGLLFGRLHPSSCFPPRETGFQKPRPPRCGPRQSCTCWGPCPVAVQCLGVRLTMCSRRRSSTCGKCWRTAAKRRRSTLR